ncbi:B12-binding domain-containing radical SAM protein [Magnetococcales bacterium HHB-1]
MNGRILLIHPHVPVELQYGTRYRWAGAMLPPLGLLYIAAVLRQAGHIVHILDANAEDLDTSKVLKQVKAIQPDIIGLTGTTLSFPENVRIAEMVKSWNPEIPIVVGGVHAQGSPLDCLRIQAFDYVIPGEGEYTFRDLVKTILNKGDIKSVPGVQWMADGQIQNSGKGQLVENLDDLPFPARDLLSNFTRYNQKIFGYRKKPHTTIHTQRGCPFHCTFCSSSKQFRDIFDKRIRAHSIDYVKEEIQQLVDRWGIRELYIVDDTFNLKKSRLYAFCEMMRKHFPKMLWSCNFEANIYDADLLRTMKQSGCWLIQVGVETGNAKIMETIEKGVTIDRYREMISLAAKSGLAIKSSFILGSPGETKESIEETISFAQSLPVHFATFGLMAPLPGSYFWDQADHYGKVDRDAYDKFSMVNASFVPHGLTRDYLKKKQAEGHKRVFLRADMIRRHLRFIRTPQDIRRYALGIWSLIH